MNHSSTRVALASSLFARIRAGFLAIAAVHIVACGASHDGTQEPEPAEAVQPLMAKSDSDAGTISTAEPTSSGGPTVSEKKECCEKAGCTFTGAAPENKWKGDCTCGVNVLGNIMFSACIMDMTHN